MAKFVTIPGSPELSKLNELLQDKETVALVEALMDMSTELPSSSMNSTRTLTVDETSSGEEPTSSPTKTLM